MLQTDGPLGLLAGDRLEASSCLPDVGLFERRSLPFVATFWRGGPAARLRHATPLLNIRGFCLERYAVDLLHSWHLGCLQYVLGEAFWAVINSGALCPALPWLTAADRENTSMRELRAQLATYYAERRRRDPDFARRGSQAMHSPKGPKPFASPPPHLSRSAEEVSTFWEMWKQSPSVLFLTW